MIVFSAVADPLGRKGARDPQSGLKQNFKRKSLVFEACFPKVYEEYILG